jgi:hypothetical protein
MEAVYIAYAVGTLILLSLLMFTPTYFAWRRWTRKGYLPLSLVAVALLNLLAWAALMWVWMGWSIVYERTGACLPPGRLYRAVGGDGVYEDCLLWD